MRGELCTGQVHCNVGPEDFRRVKVNGGTFAISWLRRTGNFEHGHEALGASEATVLCSVFCVRTNRRRGTKDNAPWEDLNLLAAPGESGQEHEIDNGKSTSFKVPAYWKIEEKGVDGSHFEEAEQLKHVPRAETRWIREQQ